LDREGKAAAPASSATPYVTGSRTFEHH